MTYRTLRTVTYHQWAYLNELATGVKTGTVLRTRLGLLGWCGNRNAFYRMIRKLKKAGLITARRIPRDPDQYRGAQSLYELTEPGWDEVIAWREFLTRRPDPCTPGKYPRTFEDEDEENWLF